MTEPTFITTGERIRNYLAVAFLISLFLNAAGTLIFPDLRHPHDDSSIGTITITHPHRVTVHTPRPTPTPQATPTPPPQRHVVQAKPFSAHVPRTHAITRRGPAAVPYVQPANGLPIAPPESPGTAAPLPVAAAPATPAPSCAKPDQEATVTNAIPPEYPDSARDLGLGAVTVLVRVTLDAQGRLADASVAQSSNNMAIDRAALRSARESSYAPRLVACRPVSGEYIFRADFQP